VTLALSVFISHRSSAFLLVIRLIAFETQLTAFYMLDPWFLATFFRSICLCFNSRPIPGNSLLRFKYVILLVYSLYAEEIQAVKLRAYLLASIPDLISI
jgi:hypothetical protein